MITTLEIMILYINGVIGLGQYVFMFIAVSFWLIVPLLLHELGHFLYFKFVLRLKNITVGVNWERNTTNKGLYVAAPLPSYDSLTNFERVGLRVWGVLFGIVPFLFHQDLFLFILYLFGCSQDIKDILKYQKRLIKF